MNLYTWWTRRVYLRVQRDISQSEPTGRRQIKARQRELHCNAIQVYLTRTHDRHEPGLQGSRQSQDMSKTPSPDYHLPEPQTTFDQPTSASLPWFCPVSYSEHLEGLVFPLTFVYLSLHLKPYTCINADSTNWYRVVTADNEWLR